MHFFLAVNKQKKKNSFRYNISMEKVREIEIKREGYLEKRHTVAIVVPTYTIESSGIHNKEIESTDEEIIGLLA